MTEFERRSGFRFGYVTPTSVATLLRWLQLLPDEYRIDCAAPQFLEGVPYGNWAFVVLTLLPFAWS